MPERGHSLASTDGHRLIEDDPGGGMRWDGQLFWVRGRQRRPEASLVVTVVDDMAI